MSGREFGRVLLSDLAAYSSALLWFIFLVYMFLWLSCRR